MTRKKPKEDKPVEFISLMLHESDRGCVRASVAAIDYDLKRLVKMVFSNRSTLTPSHADSLLKPPHGQLLSSWLQTSLLGAFGIINHDLVSARNKIGKVRNDFAHWQSCAKIEKVHTDSLIDSMVAYSNEIKRNVEIMERAVHEELGADHSCSIHRINFMAAALTIWCLIVELCHEHDGLN